MQRRDRKVIKGLGDVNEGTTSDESQEEKSKIEGEHGSALELFEWHLPKGRVQTGALAKGGDT